MSVQLNLIKTAQKVKFSINDIYSICDKISWKLWIWFIAEEILSKKLFWKFFLCSARNNGISSSVVISPRWLLYSSPDLTGMIHQQKLRFPTSIIMLPAWLFELFCLLFGNRTSCTPAHELPWGYWETLNNQKGTFSVFFDYVCITFILLLWDLSNLFVMNHFQLLLVNHTCLRFIRFESPLKIRKIPNITVSKKCVIEFGFESHSGQLSIVTSKIPSVLNTIAQVCEVTESPGRW